MSKTAKKVGLSLAELNAKYNPNVLIPNKIRAAFKDLGDNAVGEDEFRRLCGISAMQLAAFASQFEDYIILVRENGRQKRLWAGTPAFAKKAQDAING